MSADNLMSDAVMVPRPKAYPLSTGQEIDLFGHRWVVKGIHLGALGQESLIHLEGLSHEPGWTGPWEFHPMLFVPEIMLSAAMLAASTPVGGWEEAEREEALALLRTINRECDIGQHEADVLSIIDRLSVSPPPSVSTDNGSRPQEAVPTEAHETAVVGEPIVRPPGAPLNKGCDSSDDRFVTGPVWFEPDLTDEDGGEIWTSEVQAIGGWNVVATVHGATEAEASSRAEVLCRALNAVDGCSSNEGADIECPACEGFGNIVEAATTTGANQHSACQRDCEDCDGSGRILPQTEKGS